VAAPELQPAENAKSVVRSRLLVLAGAVAIGLVLQQVLSARLEAIVEHSHRDLLAARAELAGLLRAFGLPVFGLTAALGAAMTWACRHPSRAQRFPPPGLLSFGARSVVTGPLAPTLTRVGLALGALLVSASLAGAGLVWYMAAVLLACRAGLQTP